MGRWVLPVLRVTGCTAGPLSAAAISWISPGQSRGLRTESAKAASSVSGHGGDAGKAEILERARNLRLAYRPAYAFPRWVCEQYISEHFAQYQSDAEDSAIFFDEGDPRGEVLLLATQREPVNIGMRRAYDQASLAANFGWGTGIYGPLGTGVHGLPPNIALMSRTPLVSGLRGPNEEPGEQQLTEIQDPSNRVHILSVIGYAFDNPKQPDQAYFLEGRAGISSARRRELTECFGRVFDKIFAAALHCDRAVIVLSKFGAGAFSENYPGSLFDDVWLPAFKLALAAWAARLQVGGVEEISLMGGEQEESLARVIQENGFSSELYSYFPEPLRRQLGPKLSQALLVNAWDCWSLVGNGNFVDNSLDGFMGRATALAVLGWPMTNPHLKNNLISVKRPS